MKLININRKTSVSFSSVLLPQDLRLQTRSREGADKSEHYPEACEYTETVFQGHVEMLQHQFILGRNGNIKVAGASPNLH